MLLLKNDHRFFSQHSRLVKSHGNDAVLKICTLSYFTHIDISQSFMKKVLLSFIHSIETLYQRNLFLKLSLLLKNNHYNLAFCTSKLNTRNDEEVNILNNSHKPGREISIISAWNLLYSLLFFSRKDANTYQDKANMYRH